MRTTLTIDDELLRQIKRKAIEADLTVSAFIERALRLALDRGAGHEEAPFELLTWGSGGTVGGLSIDRTSELFVHEDEAIYGEDR